MARSCSPSRTVVCGKASASFDPLKRGIPFGRGGAQVATHSILDQLRHAANFRAYTGRAWTDVLVPDRGDLGGSFGNHSSRRELQIFDRFDSCL